METGNEREIGLYQETIKCTAKEQDKLNIWRSMRQTGLLSLMHYSTSTLHYLLISNYVLDYKNLFWG